MRIARALTVAAVLALGAFFFADALLADGPDAGRGQDVQLGRRRLMDPGFPVPTGTASTDPARFPREGDDFGAAVAIIFNQDTTVEIEVLSSYAVGAPGADSGAEAPLDPVMGDPSTIDPSEEPPRRGGAVFLLSPGNLFVLKRIGNPNPSDTDPQLDRFGASMVQLGNVLFVGAPGGTPAGESTHCGVVYGFNCDVAAGNNFGRLILTIPNPFPEDGDEFGAALGTAGATLLIGAPGRDVSLAQDVGTVYQYFVGPQLGFIVELPNPLSAIDPFEGEQSRFGAAVSGAQVTIGGAQSPPVFAITEVLAPTQLLPGQETLAVAAIGAPRARNIAQLGQGASEEGAVFVFNVDPADPLTHGEQIGQTIFSSSELGGYVIAHEFGAAVKVGQASTDLSQSGSPSGTIFVAIGSPGDEYDEDGERRGSFYVYGFGDFFGGQGAVGTASLSAASTPLGDFAPLLVLADFSAHGDGMELGRAVASRVEPFDVSPHFFFGSPGFTIDDTFDFSTGNTDDNLPLTGFFPRAGGLDVVDLFGQQGSPQPPQPGAPPATRAVAVFRSLFGGSPTFGFGPGDFPSVQVVNPEPDDLYNPSQGPPTDLDHGDRFGAALAATHAPHTEIVVAGAPKDDELGRPNASSLLQPIPDVGSFHVFQVGAVNHVPEPGNDCAGSFFPGFGATFSVDGTDLTGNDFDEDFNAPNSEERLTVWRADAFSGRFQSPPRDAAGDTVELDRTAPRGGRMTFHSGGRFFGDRLIRYIVKDTGGNYAAAFAIVRVENEGPDALDTLVTIPSDSPNGLQFSTQNLATDPERDSGLTDRVVFRGLPGDTTIFSGDGTIFENDEETFTYNPLGGSGPVEIRFTVMDRHDVSTLTPDCTSFAPDTTIFQDTTVPGVPSGSDSASIFLLVNTPPTSDSTVVSIDEDESLTLFLAQRGLISDPDTSLGDPFTQLRQTLHGKSVTRGGTIPPGSSAFFEADGTSLFETHTTLFYQPGPDFFGDDTVFYTVSDMTEESSPAGRILIHVNPINDPPFAPDTTVFIDEDTTAFLLDTSVFGDIDDVDDTSFGVTDAFMTSGPGQTSRPAAGAPRTAYAPPVDFDGTAFFEVDFTDGNGSSGSNGPLGGSQRVKVVVRPVNDAPVVADTTVFVLEDTELLYEDASAFAATTDVDDGAFAIDGASLTGAGAVARPAGQPRTRYTPPGDFFGTVTLNVALHDLNASGAANGTLTATQRVTVRVLPVNDPPVCRDLAFTIPEDTSATADVTSEIPEGSGTVPIVTDVDGDGTGLVFQLFLIGIGGAGTTPDGIGRVKTAHGLVTFSPTGERFTYRPDAGFVGDDAFTYTVADKLQALPVVAAPSPQPQPDLSPKTGTGTVTMHVTAVSGPVPSAAHGRVGFTGGGLLKGSCAAGPDGALNMAHVLGLAIAALAVRSRRRQARRAP